MSARTSTNTPEEAWLIYQEARRKSATANGRGVK